MANIDNECKDLEVQDFYDNSTTHLEDIMTHQKEMQEQTYGFNFEDMSIREVMNFWHVNTHAVVDEIHEMTDALGGIKDGSGNAVWKYWKKDFSKYETMKISDLSEDDKKEIFIVSYLEKSFFQYFHTAFPEPSLIPPRASVIS